MKRIALALIALGFLPVSACGGEDGTTTDRDRSGAASETEPSSDRGAPPPGEDSVVEGHIDGDTLAVGGGVKVRLIGIDTPETKHPEKPVQCFGTEASAFLADLLPVATEVRLVYDVERRDRYGRTLAYIYRSSDGLFVNAELVREGYAAAYTVPPNVAHGEEFAALQAQAREKSRGLWGKCDGTATPPTTSESAGGCDPSYPDVCIPPPPPDLDCGDTSERAFSVEGPDPHRFDGNANGIGCE